MWSLYLTAYGSSNYNYHLWANKYIDCSVDVADAVLLARFCTEDRTGVITDQGKQNADYDGDGSITMLDFTAILRTIAKL